MRHNDDDAAWKRVTKWLDDNGQAAYIPLFLHHGVVRLSLVELLSLQDLEARAMDTRGPAGKQNVTRACTRVHASSMHAEHRSRAD